MTGRMFTDTDRYCLEIDGKGLYWMIPPDVSSLLRFSRPASIENDGGVAGRASLRYQASILLCIDRQRYVVSRQDILSLASESITTAPIRVISPGREHMSDLSEFVSHVDHLMHSFQEIWYL